MKKSVIILIAFLFLSFFLNATHNRAGEILYKRIAPFTTVVGSNTVQVFTYSITVIKYTDSGSNIADRCVDTVYFGDGTHGVAPRINGGHFCCGTLNGDSIGCGNLISNDPTYVVKMNIYSIIHTYAAQGSFVVKSKDPGRNAGIINIPNSDSSPFCISSLIVIDIFSGANSSPQLSFPPVDQGEVNLCFLHNPGAFDPDGDSLSYELVNCECAAGYSDPLTGVNGSFNVDAVTGLITWCTPQQLGEYNLALQIKEWRKNTSGHYENIGYITRDMQVLVNSIYTGLSEINLNGNIQVFPNPVQNEITVRSQSLDMLNVKIYNLTGQLVFQKNLEAKQENVLNLENIQKGVYNLEIKTSGGTIVKKLLKD